MTNKKETVVRSHFDIELERKRLERLREVDEENWRIKNEKWDKKRNMVYAVELEGRYAIETDKETGKILMAAVVQTLRDNNFNGWWDNKIPEKVKEFHKAGEIYF